MTSTSVRVALRVRPLNNKEILQNCSECLTIIPDAPQILIGTDKSFTFDYVFPSDTEQEEIFHDCASPLIDKLMEGQTGSGKTYSMGTALYGSDIPPEYQGIIPRAISKLFADLNERKEKNPSYEFEVYVSFLELYNEDFIDLLNKKGKSDLMIREDANSQIYWAGVKEVQVSDSDELLGQLQKGSLCRTVASTDMNMVSSRSHAIFSVILKQTRVENLKENKENDAPPPETSTTSKRKSKQKLLTSKVTSKFHFVDLAGSERRTNAVGDRAKEGIAINGGLLALGNVISALGDESRKVTHIPYRDSKLTRLLQDSLGGNSQTLMLACVSPADSNFMETLSTLKYANRARNIKNKVSVNESYGGNSIEINQLRGQISRLKMEIQTLRAGGCNEETSRKHEEEIESLKNELGMTKWKLKNVEQELITTKAERNTLLMEISFNDQDLSDADREHRIKTHNIVQGYESEIQDFKNQISELLAAQAFQHLSKSSLAGTTTGREKGHIKFSDPHIYSSDEDIHNLNNNNNNNNNNKENSEKKGKKKKKRTSIRADGHFPVSDETSTTKISPVGPSSSHHQLEHVVNDQSLEEAKSLFTPYDEDEENIEEEDGEDGENVDGESFKFTRKLRRRSKTRDKLEKAKEQLRQSYMIIKNGGSLHDDPILSQLIKQPSSTRRTKSENYIDQMIRNHQKEKRRSSSVSFSEIQIIEVPEWQESNPQPPQPTRRTSNSGCSVSFSDRPISSGSTEYSQDSTDCSSQQQQQNVIALTRMLHQIQADIAVKEQLVSQLERAEQEYTYMRAQYEQKLADMQEAIITLQQERNSAVKRAQNANTGVSTRDKNSILVELKSRYEHKMKRLIQEIGELRRKYNEATQSTTTSKNQNETMLKSMRAQIEQLKSEKMRAMKRMKDEAERVREMTERNQREIQNLRRKEKSAQEQKKRFERTSEMQKIMLEKRQEEVLQTNSKLKSVMALLKRTTTPKSITKAIRNHKRQSISNDEDRKESRRSSDDISPIYDEVFASGYDKKKLLDEAIYKYISGRQTLTMMDEWIVKRNNLQEEKNELLEKREKIITSEIGNELGGDAQALDDKIGMITSEISYITAKIHSLQSSIAAEQEEKAAENSKESEDKSRKNSIKSSKIKKKLSFLLPENATPEASYDVAVRILRNLDEFESYTILESFFKDIVDLKTGDWSRQMTLEQQEKTIIDLRKTLLAMRRAAVLTTSEYEKKNRELEEALRFGGGSLSPSTPEKRELQMDDIENSTSNAISLFDHKLDQAYAEVEAEISGTFGQMGSLSRRNSYFFDDDAAYFSSSPLSASPLNTGNNRTSFSSRPPIPPGWLNLQPREKVLEQTNETTPDVPTNPRRKDSGNSESSGDNNNNTKRRSSNGRRLKRPSNGPSTPSTPKPSTPKDENISPLERTRSIGQPLERTRSSNQHLERARAGVQLSSSRRSSLRDGSGDKRRSQSSMARRGSKDHIICDKVHMDVVHPIVVSSVSSGYPGGVEDTLATLERRREEYGESPEPKVQA
ncbi:P-loop containing nucleoside triphosphate hydrolase protein [Rhizophagus irregularis DAOM 181602=DAOM 197198]|nr:P-loop containing nucleoside triphosphate hydrolase protein [Rhizophagus irregularis DAOM 181602=DAOM 197198]